MLSNVTFKKTFDLRSIGRNVNELIYIFSGHSMEDYSDMQKAKDSIFGSNDDSTTTIHCEYACCLQNVQKEVEPLDGKLYIVESFFNDPFIAGIKTVGASWIIFEFHNPDKTAYPDQYLRFDEIKSLHLVTTIWYNKERTWCHCGSEGDYCGEGCKQPQNNPELQRGGQ